MRPLVCVVMVVLAATCGPDPNAQLPGRTEATGGRAEGGSPEGSGGARDTGGTTQAAGGRGGAGGRSIAGRGGATSTGGQATGGGRADASAPAGGGRTTVGNGGAGGTGGTTGTPPRLDAGGLGAGGNVSRTDASVVKRDVASASCPGLIVDNGYACGSATSCSECKDNNGVSREAGCKKGLDCLAAAGPSCDSNCQLGCMNQAGDSQVQQCIKALQTACSSSSCEGTPPPNGGG